MSKLIYCVVLLLCSGSVLVCAQNDIPEVGDEFISTVPLDAWESYPSGLLFARGERVATITVDRPYIVRDKRVVRSLLDGSSHYLRLEPKEESSNDPCARASCWVQYQQEDD